MSSTSLYILSIRVSTFRALDRLFDPALHLSNFELNCIIHFIVIQGRGRYPALGHLLPWAISLFFLNEKKINIFCVMHIALFLKVTY